MGSAIVKYDSDNGPVEISPEIIRKYLVNGTEPVTDQEVAMFLQLCKYQRLNPFLREAYLIKFKNNPATIVTGKEVFTKRAMKNQYFAGMQAGVVIQKTNEELEYRAGALVLDNEKLVGGWAKVYKKGYNVPIENVASFKEYCRMKDGQPMKSWASMPATMIRKVALVQALREAFPDDFAGLYSQEEMPVDATTLDTKPVEVEFTEIDDVEKDPEKPKDDDKYITEIQRKSLYTAVGGKENVELLKDILQKLGYKDSKTIEKDKYAEVLEAIKKEVEGNANNGQNNDIQK